MGKRFVAVLLLSFLLFPFGIALIHAFHEHNDQVCEAYGEHHIHKEQADCDQLHYFSPTLNLKVHEFDSLQPVYWNDKDQSTHHIFLSHDVNETGFDRGPPNVIVF